MAEPALQFRTVGDFLTWERQQPLRWEWYGGEPVAMTGGTNAHSIIFGNLLLALAPNLRKRGCRAHVQALKVMTAGAILYPDLVVTCTQASDTDDIAHDPVLIAEVLSPSTASYDRNAKRALYRLLPSLQYYLLVEQSTLAVEIDGRDGEGWSTERVTGRGGVVRLPSLGVVLPLTAIYDETTLLRDAG